MKRTLLLLLIISNHCFSQITSRKIAPPSTSLENVKYDSSKNFLGDKPMGYLGQELYVKQVTESVRQYGYSGFLLDPSKSDLDESNTYKCCQSYHSKNAELNGKYFKVTEITKHPQAAEKDYLYGNKYFFKLARKDNQDVVYYAYDAKYENSFPFLTTGFFEKQKKSVVGQKFVFCDGCIKSALDINTGKPITQMSGQKWTCTDLTIEEKYYNLALVCQNEKGEQMDISYDSMFGQYHEGRTYTEKEADSYRSRFGADDFSLILASKVRIGMTKEMCKLSWGTPNDINETVSSGKRSEQWVYTRGYLYFDNGLLTTIQ